MKLIESPTYNQNLERIVEKFSFSELQGKRILIAGGLGLIGSSVVDILLKVNEQQEKEIDITIGARNKTTFIARYGEETDCLHFRQYESSETLGTDKGKFDYIVYAAGVSSPNLYVSHPVETLEGNIIGIKNVLEYTKANPNTKILYVSSSEVYGTKTTKAPFTEDLYGFIDYDNIRSSYGVAKIASEMLCRAYQKEFNANSIIVRPGHIFGPSAHRNDQRIASLFVRKALNGENIILNSTGLQKRSYCYSLDCAAAMLYLLIHGQYGESYNIGSNEETSILEMSKTIATEAGINLSYRTPTNDEKEMSNPMDYSVLSSEKLKKTGFSFSFTTKEGFVNTLKILAEIEC